MMSEHGYGRYSSGCRCEICRAAKSTYMRERRGRAGAIRELSEASGWGRNFVPDAAHGISGYQDSGCRCETCRSAKAAASARESRWQS